MKTLIIGGEFTSQFRDVLDGASAWVDIVNGVTHQIHYITWADQVPGPDGVPITVARYRLPVAVHPEITGHPAATQIAQQGMTNMAISQFMHAHAIPADTGPQCQHEASVSPFCTTQRSGSYLHHCRLRGDHRNHVCDCGATWACSDECAARHSAGV